MPIIEPVSSHPKITGWSLTFVIFSHMEQEVADARNNAELFVSLCLPVIQNKLDFVEKYTRGLLLV